MLIGNSQFSLDIFVQCFYELRPEKLVAALITKSSTFYVAGSGLGSARKRAHAWARSEPSAAVSVASALINLLTFSTTHPRTRRSHPP